MRSVTELMERASQYRRMARSEHDRRIREILLQVSRDYDARVCAQLRGAQKEQMDVTARDLSPSARFADNRRS